MRPGSPIGGVSIEEPPGVREGAFGKLYLAYLPTPTATRSAACTGYPA